MIEKGGVRMKRLQFKGKYFKMIKSKGKILEARVNYPNLKNIKQGQLIDFFWESSSLRVRINNIRHYGNFEEMVENEAVEKLIPGLGAEKALKEYNYIYPAWKVEKLGVVVFEFTIV